MTAEVVTQLIEWPYPVRYEEETEVMCDVLVLGGGLAGCHAAISAAKRGAKVAVVEKGATIRSGSGGAGIDHWHSACTNPCCKISPEEMVTAGGGQGFGHLAYIVCKESWDALLDLEQMGLQFRDVTDEFKGAMFRDDATKIMFAYDYETRHNIRLRGGAKMKPVLYNELKQRGVEIYDRVMATRLLTEGGRQGAPVVGATGVNVRTGEFYVFRAKATVLSTGGPLRMWVFSTELVGSGAAHGDPNCAGDGLAMAWRAGAAVTNMERSSRCEEAALDGTAFTYPGYGAGNAHNTWFACTIVDANGKEVPWVDRDGRVLTTVAERYRPAPGQKFFVLRPTLAPYEIRHPFLVPDLPERIRKGEFVLPFYADLPSMPEHERRAIWGLMVGNEGKTRVPVYKTYTDAGFDPDQDMLQVNVLPPQEMGYSWWWRGVGPSQWRAGGGFLVVDWDLQTTLNGLYAAGTTSGGGGAAGASATGRYAGRKAGDYARTASEPVVNRRQVDDEKMRVYAPIKHQRGVGWKELHAGICRIMQDYCGEYKGAKTLQMGLRWLRSIRESEAARAYARNPHELWRTLECLVRLTVGEMIMHASLSRKASSPALGFTRLDYPEMDPPEWNKFVTIQLESGAVKVGELPRGYWLKSPNASTYEENYRRHCSLAGDK